MSRVVTNLLILNLHLIIDSNKTKSGYSRFKALSMNMLLLIYLESMKKIKYESRTFSLHRFRKLAQAFFTIFCQLPNDGAKYCGDLYQRTMVGSIQQPGR